MDQNININAYTYIDLSVLVLSGLQSFSSRMAEDCCMHMNSYSIFPFRQVWTLTLYGRGIKRVFPCRAIFKNYNRKTFNLYIESLI